MKEIRRFQRFIIVLFITLNAMFMYSMKGLEFTSVFQYSLLTALIATGVVLFFSRRKPTSKNKKY